MRIVAARTLSVRVVLVWLNALDFGPFTGGIRKIGMTPEAEFAAPVQGQLRRVFGMGPCRVMAVFALDEFMTGGTNLLLLLRMAVLAVFLALKFRLKSFPLSFVGLPIPSIHVPAFMDAEILGDDKGSGY
jgi:hypothetical protein